MKLKYKLLEHLEDGVIIISTNGIIEDINNKALSIFKYNYEEIVGKSLNVLMFEKDAKYHDIFIQKHLQSGSKNPLRQGKELDGKDKYNNKISLYISVVRYFENEIKFIGFIRKLENQFFNELNQFKSIFLVSKEYKIFCNLDGNILNKHELYSLLGFDEDDSLSNSIFNLVHFDDLEKIQLIFKKIRENSEIHNEVIRILRKNGREMFFSWNSNILPTSNEKNQNKYHQYVTIAQDITDVIKKDEKITIFENTINENPNAILIANSDGNVEYVNETFLKNLKLTKSAVLKKNLFSSRFFIEPEIKIDIYSLIEFNGIWKGEITLNSNEEDKKTFFITIKGIKNNENKIINYIEMIEDISSLQSVYDQVETEKNKLIEILEVIPEGILLLDQKGNLIQLNSSIITIYSSIYKKELSNILVGKKLLKIEEKNLFIDTLKELFTTGEDSRYIEPISGTFLKILRIQIKSGSIFIFYDISNEMKITQFRNQIISTVSHELRTPISSITQSLYNFVKYKDRLNDYEKNRIIKIAYKNSQLLGEIVDDLLVISQIDNKKLSLVVTKIDLSQILKEIIDQFNVKLQNKNLDIKFITEDNYNVDGDLKRLSQVFRIIIDNAIKYSPKNTQIDISFNKENNYRTGVVVKIKDQGIGIANEDLPFLFNRFYRAKNVSNIKGTGLGLSIAKSLVEMHHGDIHVLSNINQGTEFQIFLPDKMGDLH